MPPDTTQRWRLILGRAADPEAGIPLQGDAKGMDKVLEALYDSGREGGLGRSSPRINRWLGDIRKYFPTSMVQLMQRDALDRLDLKRMLLEPELLETVVPDVHLVSTLLTLKEALPDETRETARSVIRKIVEELEDRLRLPMQQALRGSLNRASRKLRPRHQEINWHRTILKNLKHYQPDYQTIIPAELIGHGRRRHGLKEVFLLVDQSGSMANSVVYAGVLSCIMASVRSLRTRLIAFDTSVVDLTEYLDDPVELLMATQLGGGTDIARAIAYVEPLIQRPADTVLVLISDLFEGGNEAQLLQRMNRIQQSGVRCVALLTLSDEGAPAYSRTLAGHLAGLGIPAFACTPDQFPQVMADAIS